jgi:adenylyltransferase/sulfurtransferase
MGAGALGSTAAELMVRAGTGSLKLIDRDFVELSNLQRQSLYDEEDVRQNLPKAIAAASKLQRINSAVRVEGIVDDVNPGNVEDYIQDADLVLDALDNFETRLVLNDACAKHRRVWIHSAAVGSYGVVMPIVPGQTPCLKCMIGGLPAPGTSPTCETEGVIGPATHLIASIQAAEALKWISGDRRVEDLQLVTIDIWEQRFQKLALHSEVMRDCAVCNEGRFEYLDGEPLRTVVLCGRNAVQLIPSVKGDLDFAEVSRAVAGIGEIQHNEFLMKCSSPPFEMTLFKDGRAIIKGTEDAATARSFYSKIVSM